MNRMPPVEIRKMMDLVNAFTKSGVWFVPMPALSDDDYKVLLAKSGERLALMHNSIVDSENNFDQKRTETEQKINQGARLTIHRLHLTQE
jgi:hypothetical protein